MSNQIEEKDDSSGEPMCMNWPPSRGPEPEWMTQEPKCIFPQPVLLDDFDDGPVDEETPLIYTWAYVKDLILAGPALSDRLVVGAETWTPEDQLQQNQEFVADEVINVREKKLGDFTPCSRTITYLDIRHPGIDARPLTAVLDYPFGRRVGVRIEPYTFIRPRHPNVPDDEQESRGTYQTLGWVLWSLARAYELIYAEHEKYGVWGHSIRDLCFETFSLNGDHVSVGVGS